MAKSYSHTTTPVTTRFFDPINPSAPSGRVDLVVRATKARRKGADRVMGSEVQNHPLARGWRTNRLRRIAHSLNFSPYPQEHVTRIPLKPWTACSGTIGTPPSQYPHRSRIMPHAWNRWEGQVVNGEFTLLRYLGGSERSGVFLTEVRRGERLLRAAIKLIPAGGENDELQLSRWRLAAELSHLHLIAVFDGGRCEIGGVPLLYVVMECAEENLAQVLPGRALTPAEAREMLEGVLDVLGYLHSKGFVHGHVKPINIMANGDQLKVSSDGLCRAGESLEHPGGPDAYGAPENAPEAIAGSKALSPASDVWSLGMTLVETLTQNLPAARTAKQQELLVPPTLPEPFLDIARHCLVRDPQERWTVVQIAARLQERTPAPQVRAPLLQPRAPARPPQPKAMRLSRPPVKRHGYGIPVTAGVVLVLAAIVAL